MAGPLKRVGALMLQNMSSQVERVVLARNIEKLSLTLRQSSERLALQGRGTKEMILILIRGRLRAGKCEVTDL
ncbi:hypothetical protein [Bradyrhizobium sp. Arg816]|uniref:hypothetical protein n=2 Tax=Nitrobacteraceae TaxID=41294 RepID=UPI00249EE77A|nr:hypothetical protein [Bradyrhizobium sp. Arg816]MDI3559122.1 hypothetical protein [Bradyrhizobium sp. Arg816]